MQIRENVNGKEDSKGMKHVPYRLAEALKRICKKKSLENITVSQIAAEAELTRQVFYRYFEDKFELAQWMHYMDLYEVMKKNMEENPQGNLWKKNATAWLQRIMENRIFYTSAIHSSSQKEFQRNIRDFFYQSYQNQIQYYTKKEVGEEIAFVLHVYCIGAMEKVFEWVEKGMPVSAEKMVELLELSMPEMIHNLVVKPQDIPYAEIIKLVEEFLQREGLLQ